MSFKNMLVESWKNKKSEEKGHGTHPHDKDDEKERSEEHTSELQSH